MNNEPIKTINYKGCVIKIYQDLDPQDPREWDSLGKMICFHGRYNLGDKTDLNSDMFSGWEELAEHLIKEEKAVVILPLYLYDHSGLRMKVGSFRGLLPQGHTEFDSGQVGFIYCTAKDILNNWNKKKLTSILKKKAEKVLRGEVETYDKYLSGQVYSFNAETKEGEDIDCVSGYYDTNYATQKAKGSIDYYLDEQNKKKQRKLKALIKNKVNLDKRVGVLC